MMNSILKYLVCCIVLSCSINTVVQGQTHNNSQDEFGNRINDAGVKRPPSNIKIEGTFNFAFTNNRTLLLVSPIITYEVLSDLRIGAGPTFRYLKIYDNNYYDYGGRLLARYNLSRDFHTEAQYQYLSYDFGNTRQSDHGLFLGGGLSKDLGIGRVYISYLYDVLYDEDKNGYRPPYMVNISFSY